MPRRGGWRAWGAVRDEFERALAAEQGSAGTLAWKNDTDMRCCCRTSVVRHHDCSRVGWLSHDQQHGIQPEMGPGVQLFIPILFVEAR